MEYFIDKNQHHGAFQDFNSISTYGKKALDIQKEAIEISINICLRLEKMGYKIKSYNFYPDGETSDYDYELVHSSISILIDKNE